MTEMEKGGGEWKSATTNKGNDERLERQEESGIEYWREEERWLGGLKKINKGERQQFESKTGLWR